MDEKIFLSNKESKTIAELKAIGGINLPVFKDGIKMYKTSLDELLSDSQNTVILPYETATYAIINEIAQIGKQVIIYYMGVDGSQFWTLSHKTAESSYVFTWVNGNSLVKKILPSDGVWTEEAINLKMIKDNAYDSGTDPVHPDNITDVEQLIFFRHVGADANYTMVESEARIYGVLIPPPSMQADQNKVPMYKNGNQIVWDYIPTQDSGVTTTVSEITENTTVTLVAGQNRYLNCTNSPTISVEIADDNAYHIQINGSCTINLTGVSWSSEAITAITTKAEISILNGIAVGVLYE